MFKKLTVIVLAAHVLIQNAESSELWIENLNAQVSSSLGQLQECFSTLTIAEDFRIDKFMKGCQLLANSNKPLRDLFSIQLDHRTVIQTYLRKDPNIKFEDLLISFLKTQIYKLTQVGELKTDDRFSQLAKELDDVKWKLIYSLI